MHSREQYLAALREEYLRATGKKHKTRLLNEARKRTKLNRKVLIRKLTRIPVAGREARRPRSATYSAQVRAPLIQVWELFEFPCGQRLAPILREQVDRLRDSGALQCSEAVAAQLRAISARTIDRLLEPERQVRRLKRERNPPVHPLWYQRVPAKVASEWDRQQVENLQLDYLLHCGRSTVGEYLLTLSATDIAHRLVGRQTATGAIAAGHARELSSNPATLAVSDTRSASRRGFGHPKRPGFSELLSTVDEAEGEGAGGRKSATCVRATANSVPACAWIWGH